MTYLRYINDNTYDASFNMAVDKFLFLNCIERTDLNPVLRIYRFDKDSVTMGYGCSSRMRLKIPQEFSAHTSERHGISIDRPIVSFNESHGCRRNETNMTRRPTGGGIVYHGNDLIYTLIVPLHAYRSLRRVQESYREIHLILVKVLSQFGIEAELFSEPSKSTPEAFCFSAPVLYDVMFQDRKVAGGGQKRSRGYLLHQGSVMIERLNAAMDGSAFRAALANQFSQYLGCELKQKPLSPEEAGEATGRLLTEKRL